MIRSGKLLKSIKAAIDTGDVRPATAMADELAAWAKRLPTLFPEGSKSGDARPEIWSDRDGFEVRATAFSAATARLAERVNGGDAAGALVPYNEVRKTCSGCHTDYKKR